MCEREVQTAFINMYAINVRKTQHEGEMQKSVWDQVTGALPCHRRLWFVKVVHVQKPNSAFCVCGCFAHLADALPVQLPPQSRSDSWHRRHRFPCHGLADKVSVLLSAA